MVFYKKGWPQEVTHPFPTMKTIILIIPLINFGSVVLDLGVVSQGIVHTIVEHFIRELASLFPDAVTKIIGSGRLRELHVFEDIPLGMFPENHAALCIVASVSSGLPVRVGPDSPAAHGAFSHRRRIV